jgi:hypothetical protein
MEVSTGMDSSLQMELFQWQLLVMALVLKTEMMVAVLQ